MSLEESINPANFRKENNISHWVKSHRNVAPSVQIIPPLIILI